eukprot:5984852-Prymnesium_polylepis.1
MAARVMTPLCSDIFTSADVLTSICNYRNLPLASITSLARTCTVIRDAVRIAAIEVSLDSLAERFLSLESSSWPNWHVVELSLDYATDALCSSLRTFVFVHLEILALACYKRGPLFHPLVDITPLCGLINLHTLLLDMTEVNDLKPIAQLSVLKRLYLKGIVASDISSLVGFVSLEVLDLGYAEKVVDFVPRQSDRSQLGIDTPSRYVASQCTHPLGCLLERELRPRCDARARALCWR